MTITQNDLKIRIKKFVTNGKHPDCQSLLAPIGYGESQLAAGETRLDTWLSAREKVQGLKDAKKSATKAESAAERSAQMEATALRETVRALWRHDESTLALFDLGGYRRIPDRSTKGAAEPTNGNGASGETTANGSTNGDGASGEAPADEPYGSQGNGHGWVSDYQVGTSERIARWRVLFAMVSKLDEAKQTQLAEFGWDTAHVDQAIGLVEKYAQADAVQQKKMKAVEINQAAAKQAEQELRRWYAQAARLTRSAIKRRVQPEQQQHMRDLLGL